ncbi:phosphate acyltransferase PlsX [Fusibacter ferrireducens]|uniref:Phosphate acyltransferase n=1 Tax=Fusibacter ferrireducens TaxID=2785058 RepID=A0ABR9ZNJ5_9FIRM|nr:phosphate acyltransferase PlsX [Fusibacter ferrireducens]MBF4691698.1 phosphate acyltransferase PlsX [Fusibacter ferrireducens]
MKIGFDAMGGDHAPVETVKGAVDALSLIEGEIVLFGDELKINKELSQYKYDQKRISVVGTTEVIENDDKPVKAIKRKSDSSMVVGMKALRKREVDAFVSAGNTGALLAGSLLKVGRIKGISRPALCTIYPTMSGASVLVDAGANAECKSRNLLEFAYMGSLYAERVIGINNPKVALVNIGAEETKGTPLYIETYQMLKETDLNFVGNVEGRDVPSGKVDVIVADGFTGNIILKLTEGVSLSIVKELKNQIVKNSIGKIAGLLLKRNLGDFKKQLDYSEYGGAPLLGVNGLVVKAHGSSNAKAFMNAIKYAYIGVESNLVAEITEKIKTMPAFEAPVENEEENE